MLLWIPTAQHGSDDDEKGAKLQRQARRRAQMTVNFLGLLCGIFFIAISQLDSDGPPHPRDAKKVRSQRKSGKISRQKKTKSLSIPKTVDFLGADAQPPLPENSIYNLEYPNTLGDIISLKRFAGQVTLVVNTACK
jgi:hypothetical protein